MEVVREVEEVVEGARRIASPARPSIWHWRRTERLLRHLLLHPQAHQKLCSIEIQSIIIKSNWHNYEILIDVYFKQIREKKWQYSKSTPCLMHTHIPWTKNRRTRLYLPQALLAVLSYHWPATWYLAAKIVTCTHNFCQLSLIAKIGLES